MKYTFIFYSSDKEDSIEMLLYIKYVYPILSETRKSIVYKRISGLISKRIYLCFREIDLTEIVDAIIDERIIADEI